MCLSPTTPTGTTDWPGQGEGRPSVALVFTAPIQAGKTTVSTKLATALGVPRVSFGDFVRQVATERNVELTRESLQELGEQLVRKDALGLCGRVLSQKPWLSGRPLIVDGVRHAEVLDILSDCLAPAPVYLIYIFIDRDTQAARLQRDPLPHTKPLNELEAHSTEQQVKGHLRERADLVLDGSQDSEELTRQVLSFLAFCKRPPDG